MLTRILLVSYILNFFCPGDRAVSVYSTIWINKLADETNTWLHTCRIVS